MEKLLQDISGVVGVTGAIVCDPQGEILASTLPGAFDPGMLGSVSTTFGRTLEALRTARRRKVSEIDLVYSSGRLVVKSAGEGFVVILCVPNINVPLLNLTANVVVRKIQEQLKERAGGAAPGKAAAAPAAVAPAAAAEPAAPAAEAHKPGDREALALIAAARERKAILRAMGDVAVRLRAPIASRLIASQPEEERLVQLAARGGQSRVIQELAAQMGYEPNARFNTLHGAERLRFSRASDQLYLEVFLDGLNSFHRLEFGSRLHLDESTLPLAELLLSHLLNVQAEDRDLARICCLLHAAELGGPGQPDEIDATFVVGLCSEDWGWYRTVTMNLGKAAEFAERQIEGSDQELVLRRARRLTQMIEESPKSLRWQVRARVGESRKWYEEPE